MSTITLPTGVFGGTTERSLQRDHEQYTAFAAALQEIQKDLDFKMGARDWCYFLEEHGLKKPDFDKAEKRIGIARKKGYLPVDFTLSDDTRHAVGDHGAGGDYEVERELEYIWDAQIQNHLNGYTPINWFDYQPDYVELLVEKKGLASLLLKVCKEHHVSLSNARGDTDIISIATMHRRFQEAQERGQQPVLLYFGDYDPKGVDISERLPNRFTECPGQWFEDGCHLETVALEIKRIGLNLENILDLGLSKIPNLLTGAKGEIKCSDGRKRSGVALDNPLHPDHMKAYVQDYLAAIADHREDTGGLNWKVEANAIVVRPEAGRQILRDVLKSYIDSDGVERYKRDLAEVRKNLAAALPGFLTEKLAA